MKKLLITILLLLPVQVWSAVTETDATPTVAEVQTLVDNATANDTIKFMGSATWASSVTIGKALTIDGNGNTLTSGATLNTGFFRITGFTDNTNLVRITGFTLDLLDQTNEHHGIKVDTATIGKLRIDHNTIHFGYEQLDIAGSFGSIDSNYFYNSRKAIQFTAGTRAQADASWVSMDAGTASALFVENNHFIDDANYPAATKQEKIGTSNGGKIVVRYNDFDFDAVAFDGTDTPMIAHGSAGVATPHGYWQDEAGANRGQSVIEFYNNVAHGPRIDFLYTSRGGANLIYNNTMPGSVQVAPRIYFYEEEKYNTEFTPLRNEWPAEDQVHNTFIWSNTYNGGVYFDQDSHIALGAQNASCTADGLQGAVVATCCTGAGTGTCDFIIKDRDFFLHAPQATGGKESFTGQNGGSNTAPTDGVTYPTLGNMTFSSSGANAYYGSVPYTCPHPLAGLSGVCNTKTGTAGYNQGTQQLGAGAAHQLGVGAAHQLY